MSDVQSTVQVVFDLGFGSDRRAGVVQADVGYGPNTKSISLRNLSVKLDDGSVHHIRSYLKTNLSMDTVQAFGRACLEDCLMTGFVYSEVGERVFEGSKAVAWQLAQLAQATIKRGWIPVELATDALSPDQPMSRGPSKRRPMDTPVTLTVPADRIQMVLDEYPSVPYLRVVEYPEYRGRIAQALVEAMLSGCYPDITSAIIGPEVRAAVESFSEED